MSDPSTPVAAMSDELLPCPFCGAEAHIIYDGPTAEQARAAASWGRDVDGGWYRAQCKSCGASVGEVHKRSEIVPLWNRRSAARPAREGREGLVGRMRQVLEHGASDQVWKNTLADAIHALTAPPPSPDVAGLIERLRNPSGIGEPYDHAAMAEAATALATLSREAQLLRQEISRHEDWRSKHDPAYGE